MEHHGLRIDPAEAGIRLSRKRVARLMRNAGLADVSRRKSTAPPCGIGRGGARSLAAGAKAIMRDDEGPRSMAEKNRGESKQRTSPAVRRQAIKDEWRVAGRYGLLLAALLRRLLQTNACTATILVDELDAGLLKSCLDLVSSIGSAAQRGLLGRRRFRRRRDTRAGRFRDYGGTASRGARRPSRAAEPRGGDPARTRPRPSWRARHRSRANENTMSPISARSRKPTCVLTSIE